MTIYHITKEQQILQDKILSELFDVEETTIPLEDYYCESIPWVDSENQSRPGKLNGMYGRKWGDKHPKGMLGKKHTEETKQKMKQSALGRHHSHSQSKKLSQSLKEYYSNNVVK